MNYMQRFLRWYQEQPANKKWGLSLSTLIIICGTACLCWWVLSPSYALLFSQLNEQDANQIIKELDNQAITYQLSHDGQDILIDKQLIAKTRLKIMGSGLNLAGEVGFELFDKNDLGMSDFSQKINYQRALQGELERTISSLEEVNKARIHLVLPEKHLFSQDNTPPKAAVTLHLKYPLTVKQIQSIQRLVSSSVPHLTVQQVVIVDQNGTTLSPGAHYHNEQRLHYKQTLEHYITDKITQLLNTLFATDQFLVRVDVALNYDTFQRELITPQASGQITHEKQIKHELVDKNAKSPQKNDLIVEKSYQLGSKKEQYQRAHATIDRVSISVAVPRNTSVHTLAQIEHLVKNASGFETGRGDKLSVEALIPPHTTKSAVIQAQPVSQPTLLPPASSTLFYILAFLLCSSGSVIFYIRQQKIKQRGVLLLELTQWLEQHE